MIESGDFHDELAEENERNDPAHHSLYVNTDVRGRTANSRDPPLHHRDEEQTLRL